MWYVGVWGVCGVRGWGGVGGRESVLWLVWGGDGESVECGACVEWMGRSVGAWMGG